MLLDFQKIPQSGDAAASQQTDAEYIGGRPPQSPWQITDTTFTFDPKADYYEFFEASMADPILNELMDDCEDYDEFLGLLRDGRYPIDPAAPLAEADEKKLPKNRGYYKTSHAEDPDENSVFDWSEADAQELFELYLEGYDPDKEEIALMRIEVNQNKNLTVLFWEDEYYQFPDSQSLQSFTSNSKEDALRVLEGKGGHAKVLLLTTLEDGVSTNDLPTREDGFRAPDYERLLKYLQEYEPEISGGKQKAGALNIKQFKSMLQNGTLPSA